MKGSPQSSRRNGSRSAPSCKAPAPFPSGEPGRLQAQPGNLYWARCRNERRFRNRNAQDQPATWRAYLIDARVRRTIVIFLLILTLVVCLRASASRGATPEGDAPHGAGAASDASRLARSEPALSFDLEEPGRLAPAAETLHRTLDVRGQRAWPGVLSLAWEARISGVVVARGREGVSASHGGLARLVLSIPLPSILGPAGLDLVMQAWEGGGLRGEATFPFTVYPAGTARTMLDRFARARVALYDPEGGAARALRSLGLELDEFAALQGLALYDGDLIVVGPGGFSRGRESLGPILAARARSGTRVLILDQPTLPGTLTEDLRLWPSFSQSAGSDVLFSAQHPILRGLPTDVGDGYLAAAASRARPLLPPTRGNFRVLAAVRSRSGPSRQEGVALLEIPIGKGVILAAQASLCADFDHDPRPRILLANALDYLLGDRPRMKRAYLYGPPADGLPLCLHHLAPYAPVAPPGLEGADLLLAPGDWLALRGRASTGLAPLAQVARFLHEGGTIVLLNPQPLVLDYLAALTGALVYFEPAAGSVAPPDFTDPSLPLVQGIAVEDLELLALPGRTEFRLRPQPGPDGVAPILIAPGLAGYRVGRGILVALTLPEASECTASPTSSLLARLLTNLGVPLDPGPGIDAQAITRLNDQTGD